MDLPAILRIDDAVTHFPGQDGKPVHPRTLRRWLEKDGVPLTRLGNHVYVEEAALEAFWRRHRGNA